MDINSTPKAVVVDLDITDIIRKEPAVATGMKALAHVRQGDTTVLAWLLMDYREGDIYVCRMFH